MRTGELFAGRAIEAHGYGLAKRQCVTLPSTVTR